MSKRGFYFQWLKRAFTDPLPKVRLVAFLLAIVGGAVAHFFPQWESSVRIGIWAAPTFVLISAVLVGFLAAPYRIYKNIERERDDGEEENRLLKDIRPSITVKSDPEDNYARLKVYNLGGSAEFKGTGEIQLEDGTYHGTPWPINWRGSESDYQRIDHNDHHILNLASIQSRRVLAYVREKLPNSQPYIRFYTSRQYIELGRHGPTYRDSFDDPIGTPELLLRVTITANPPLETPYYQFWKLKRTEKHLILEEA